jgi:hypothetical protein
MKKMKQLLVSTAILAAAFLVSCEKDFDRINKDPNGITDVPADYLLSGAVMSLSNAENGFMESFAYASDWVQYTSCGFWGDPGRYNFEKSRSFMWDNLYSGPLIDLKVMNRKAIEEGNPSLQAVSLVMYSYGFALLADCYGPVPFSEALSAEAGINKPGYDTQETVYLALLDSLEKASDLLSGLSRITVRSGYDVLFNGDAVKWHKFANALRLRIMMRISSRIDVSGRLQQLVSDPATPLPGSNADNVRFAYSAASTRTWHPLYDVLSAEASDGGYRLSKTLVDHLLATADPRIEVYGLPNGSGTYEGLSSGSGASAGQIDAYSRVNPRYGQKNRPGIFISYPEVCFLLAEAAARNLISGEAATYYEEAVRANFEELGLTEQQYATFIDSPQGRYTNQERIALQKWVSLFGRGLEGWTEYRRTGQPVLQPAAYAFVNVVPQRFLYPLSEEQTNKESLQQAGELLPNGDQLTSKLWWMN